MCHIYILYLLIFFLSKILKIKAWHIRSPAWIARQGTAQAWFEHGTAVCRRPVQCGTFGMHMDMIFRRWHLLQKLVWSRVPVIEFLEGMWSPGGQQNNYCQGKNKRKRDTLLSTTMKFLNFIIGQLLLLISNFDPLEL